MPKERKKQTRQAGCYTIRRVKIGHTSQLDALARACGEIYTRTLVFFWRTVRHKGHWLKPKYLMRLFTSGALHAHTADACVQAFFRDGVGSINIRQKYLGQFPVVGVMAPPTGLRFRPRARVARPRGRENVCAGNSIEAARLEPMRSVTLPNIAL